MDAVVASMTLPEAVRQFGPFDGRAWLNTAHQGPLPRGAVAASEHAARLKAAPHSIGDDDFTEVPEHLRGRLADLVGASAEEIVLGNSASHGLHLIANGLEWHDGDEVLTVAGDYPATVLPWQRLAPLGVQVRAVKPRGGLLTPQQLADEIGPRTRLVAVTWVDSFTGRTLDLDGIGTVCRAREVLVVVNGSQALGARPIDVCTTPVDAVVSCGYKWLCGPYGTGFTWLHPDLLDQLHPQQAYWLAMQAGQGLDQMRGTTLRHDLGVRAFDVFCPAAFATTLPWTAALELVLGVGVGVIGDYDQRLVSRFLNGVDEHEYEVLSPADGPSRSTLVVLSRRDGTTADRHRQLTQAGIDTAYREGNLRLSMHLFNTDNQIDQALNRLT
jgi:selenocysteine lyase/cysteine desulfurase